MYRPFATLFFCLALLGGASAQRFLQLEKTHSPKTRKYFPGDEITFKLANGQWYTRVIDEVKYNERLLVFASGHVDVDSIVAFRTYNSRRWSRTVGNQLYNFAIAWTGFSLISAAVDDGDPYSKGDLTVAATSVATGLLLKRAFRHRTYNLKKNKHGEAVRWRLRAMDIGVK